MSEMYTELDVVSSDLGREWIAQMQIAAPDIFVAIPPGNKALRKKQLPEVIFDFEPLESVVQPESIVAVSNDQNAPEKTIEPAIVVEPVLSEPKQESCEPIFHNPEIEKIVDEVLDRFSNQSNVVLLFVGSEQNPEIDNACAQVAGALAQRDIGKVLLIDSDLQKKSLTETSGLESQPGLAEFLDGQSEWQGLLFDQPKISLSFLAAGNSELINQLKMSRNAEKLINQSKSDFRFVCVSAGDAHGECTDLWTANCDGSYLIVNMQQSNKTIARSAVAKLQESGSEVLGCVVA